MIRSRWWRGLLIGVLGVAVTSVPAVAAPAAKTVAFNSATYAFPEATGFGHIDATRSYTKGKAPTFGITLTDQTAIGSGTDYTVPAPWLQFGKGSAQSNPLTVLLTRDTDYAESDETFSACIDETTLPRGWAAGSPKCTTVTILASPLMTETEPNNDMPSANTLSGTHGYVNGVVPSDTDYDFFYLDFTGSKALRIWITTQDGSTCQDGVRFSWYTDTGIELGTVQSQSGQCAYVGSYETGPVYLRVTTPGLDSISYRMAWSIGSY